MFLRNWARLYSNTTAAELAIEPAIAALGRRYRAQHPFFGMGHIADFALIDDKVIIEVDGKSHSTPVQKYKDARNAVALAKLGWRVVRCTNEEAINNPHVTVRTLLGDRLDASRHTTLAELEASLLALGPAPVRARPKRKKRVPKPVRASAPRRKPRAAKALPAAE